jgi:putative ABC transport system permease protein
VRRAYNAPMGSALDDLRYAFRALSHAKGLVLSATLTLAVGVGSATLMFALVNGMLLEPLPVREADRLLVAWKRTPTGTVSHYPFGAEAVAEVRQHARLLERVGAFAYNGAMEFPAVESDAASYITTGVVDGDFFRVLDVTPLLGRALLASDDVVGVEPVLVIDERLWQRRYNRAGDVVGRRLRIFEQTFTIVGVVPAVNLPRGAQAWVTIRAAAASTAALGVRRDHDVVARLRPGVTLAEARTELEALTLDYERRAGRNIVASVKPYAGEMVGDVRTPVALLFGATLLVLLIACANIANLLLLRSEARGTQLALRAVLGAGRARLARQVGMETLVLCSLGGLAGVLLAHWGLGLVVALAPDDLPRVDFLRIDWRVLLFGVAATLVAASIAAIVPALFSTRVDASVLNAGSTRMTGAAFRKSRRAFVVAQVALSMTILAAAGVLTRTLLQLQSADMGFSAERLAFVELFLPPGQYMDAKVRRPFFEELAARVGALAGVESVTPIAVLPYAGLSGWDMPRWVAEGQGPEDAQRNPGLDLQSVYPNHFETMGIPILEGRALDAFDREGAVPAAVISENAARRVWPAESPIGKRLKWGGLDSDGPWFTIVGVATTTRYRELADPRASVYLSAAQFVDGANSLALRMSMPVTTIAGALRDVVRELDDSAFVVRTQSFVDSVGRPLARPRFVALLSNVFGSMALLLAAIGLYGVLAAFVRQSAREIGVRMALGATARHVRVLIFGEAAWLTGIGILLGLAGALATGRLLRSMLFGVQPMDPFTIAMAVLILTTTTAAACYFPVRRATRIDPVALLRAD